MKDLGKMYLEARKIVEEVCGDVIGDITYIETNSRAQTRWGMCKYNTQTQTYTIQISSRILADEVPYNATMSTIVHEVLHATEGGHGHKGKWASRAEKINKAHPELKITRCTSASEFGLESYKNKKPYKYAVECPSCGRVWRKRKKTALIKQPWRFQCRPCGETLVQSYKIINY